MPFWQVLRVVGQYQLALTERVDAKVPAVRPQDQGLLPLAPGFAHPAEAPEHPVWLNALRLMRLSRRL